MLNQLVMGVPGYGFGLDVFIGCCRVQGFFRVRWVGGMVCRGLQVWSKEQGSGPCRVGVRGFESHSLHQSFLRVFRLRGQFLA